MLSHAIMSNSSVPSCGFKTTRQKNVNIFFFPTERRNAESLYYQLGLLTAALNPVRDVTETQNSDTLYVIRRHTERNFILHALKYGKVLFGVSSLIQHLLLF